VLPSGKRSSMSMRWDASSIAASPFPILAPGSATARDCSPKGDNNRIDSVKNVLGDPGVALIFPVAGRTKHIRSTVGPGQRRLVLQRRFAVEAKEPTRVIAIAVERAFQHCPKALVGSGRGAVPGPRASRRCETSPAARTPRMDSSASSSFAQSAFPCSNCVKSLHKECGTWRTISP
jgi:hypothetical protein